MQPDIPQGTRVVGLKEIRAPPDAGGKLHVYPPGNLTWKCGESHCLEEIKIRLHSDLPQGG
jgi:hypothetical protein